MTVSVKRENKNAMRPSQLPNKVPEHLSLGFALLYLFAFFKTKSLAYNYVATSAQLRPTRPDQSQYAICRKVLLSDCATLISLTLTLPLPERKGCSRYSHTKLSNCTRSVLICAYYVANAHTHTYTHTHKKGRQRTDEERYTEKRTKERVKKKMKIQKEKRRQYTNTNRCSKKTIYIERGKFHRKKK